MRLGASEVVLTVHGHEVVVSQRVVRHGVLISVIGLEVAHHVGQAGLRCGFGALFGDFAAHVHLFEVFLGCRVELVVEVVLGFLGFRFRGLVYFESRAHGAVHDDFAWRLNFLEAVKRDVIQITRRIEVPLLISQHLLEEHVAPRLPLLPLQQQIVGARDLVVLIVLNVSHRLIQIAIRTNAGRCKTILDFRQVLFQHGHAILAYDDALELGRLDLLVPLVVADVFHGETLGRVCVEDLFYQVPTRLGNDARYQIVTVQYLLVEFARVRVLEG